MPTYIALLRGINVSGQKKIKMAELRAHLAELEYHNLQTYIQSGNIVFETEEMDIPALEQQIHDKIEEKYGFDVPVMIRTAEELGHALSNNPFQAETEADPKKMAFTFLGEEPSPERIAILSEVSYPPEKFVLEGRTIYYYSPNGFARAKMSNNLFESKLKVRATTRNWRTTNILWEMGKK